MLLSLFAAGLYQLRLIDDLRRTMLRLAAGVTAGGLITSMVFYLLPLKWLAPNVVGICLATSIVGLIATRLFFYCFLTIVGYRNESDQFYVSPPRLLDSVCQ